MDDLDPAAVTIRGRSGPFQKGIRARAGLALLRLRGYASGAQQRRRTCQSQCIAGRVAGHLQRAGHAALDGTGVVPAGDTAGVIVLARSGRPRGLADRLVD